MIDGVQLGPFRLEEHLGEGGMGVVYRARHVDTGGPVAVKVLLSAASRHPEKQRGFTREIQALAKLHHPAIATIADFGEIGPAAAREGPQTFIEGTPWFAMEFVEGRPLAEAAPEWSWSELAVVLRTVLDGLAHAHARSIIHRDLKPSNILIPAPRDGTQTTAKLVDFGVARLFDREDAPAEPEDDPDHVSGTPRYMAPEHIFGEWRDQGPWTDLYALGCMTWMIVCNRAPFVGDTTNETLRKHVREPLPEFEPRMPVPEDLADWLRGLMHKEPERRTRRAADAAWQLARLDAPEGDLAAETGEAPGEIETAETLRPTLGELDATFREWSESDMETEPETILDPAPLELESPNADAPSRRAATVPPVVDDWRRDREHRTAAPAPRTGLNLFGLREVPVVDRRRERDELWQQLRAVAREGSTRMITVEAGPGSGKTRLAEWLHHRSHELGAASVFRATHTREGSRGAGLREMLQRRFRTAGLDRGEVFEHLVDRLPVLDGDDSRLVDCRALTELLRPTDDDAAHIEGPRYQFSSPQQKFALLRRLFERIATERPAIVWFDDLQWGEESLEWVEDLFEHDDERPPILIVATLRSDVLAEDPERQNRFDALCSTPEIDRLRLTPLKSEDHRLLLDRLLDLEPNLADTVATRTEGNPLFAIQLLRDWVDRGMLVPGDRGFELADGSGAEMPDDIHDLWLVRLSRFVEARPAGERASIWRALEWAAALGREVDREEWRAICSACGLDRPEGLRDGLVQRGLAEPDEAGWALTHGLLVDSLARHAREAGRWREHHRRSAELLEQVHPERRRSTALRRVHHWNEAGEREEMLEPLLEEAERLRQQGNAASRRETLERREQLLDDLDLPDDDPRRVENDIEWGAAALQLGLPPEEIRTVVESARHRAEEAGETGLLAKACGISARCHRGLGAPDRAEQLAERAVEHARETDDTGMLAEMLVESGWTSYLGGDLERASERYDEAIDRAAEADARYFEAMAYLGTAWVVQSRGDQLRAGEILEHLLEESREVGYRALEAEAVNGLGEIARFEGDADRARRFYHQQMELSRELNRPEFVAVSHLNVALVDLMDGRFDDAAEGLEFLVDHERHSEKSERAELIRTFRIALAAGTERWERFDRHLEPYTDGWPEDEHLLKDHAWLMELAGDYAAEHGAVDRASTSLQLARHLWSELGNQNWADRVADKLDDLPS